MSTEVQLKPGWLRDDVRKASERLSEWATSRSSSGQDESVSVRTPISGKGRQGAKPESKKESNFS